MAPNESVLATNAIPARLFELGILLQLRGRGEEARPYLERALAAREEVCGGSHPATELVRDNLTILDT